MTVEGICSLFPAATNGNQSNETMRVAWAPCQLTVPNLRFPFATFSCALLRTAISHDGATIFLCWTQAVSQAAKPIPSMGSTGSTGPPIVARGQVESRAAHQMQISPPPHGLPSLTSFPRISFAGARTPFRDFWHFIGQTTSNTRAHCALCFPP